MSGPYNRRRRSGNPGLTWLQLFISDPGAHIAFNSSTDRQSTKSFDGCTITDNPSVPTRISMYSIPFAAAASLSESLIGRDAFDMSVSPVVNRLKPPPVPDTATFTCTPGWPFRNSSATACVTGNAVDEPSICIVPLSSIAAVDAPGGLVGAGVGSDEHAATSIAARAAATIAKLLRRRLQGLIAPPPEWLVSTIRNGG